MQSGAKLKALRQFDYKLVQERLDGLLINVDRDLQRAIGSEPAHPNVSVRGLLLLDLFVRFAKNAYHALGYVMADTPEDSSRRANYALIIPPVNRQLLDLLFSLVYMLDDFENRSLAYQRAGWREAEEEFQKFKTEFSNINDWRPFLQGYRTSLDNMVPRLGITASERKNKKLVPYWKHPFDLKDGKTRSRGFLRWLDKWLYSDTSAQSHLSFGGLIRIAPFLAAEIVGGQDQELVESRVIHQYRFQQFSRTAVVVLAILTEIDTYCKLG